MTRNEFEDLFEQFTSQFIGKQKKLNVSSVLPVYYGLSTDGYRRLAFLSVARPPKIESTKILRVTQGKESDGVYWTCFDLLNDNAKIVYYSFCSNLVLSITNINIESQALSSLKTRFIIWKSLFKSEFPATISLDTLQGLYGELYFIKKYLLNKYECSKIIFGWSGPEAASKDFSMDDIWYEVKTIGSNVPTIKISSITQLTSDKPGYLIVIKTEQMSSEYSAEDSSIVDLIDSIIKELNDEATESVFMSKILSYGQNLMDSFSNIRFNVNSMKIYGVIPGFPRITVDEVPYTGITNVSYEIALAALDPFLEEEL